MFVFASLSDMDNETKERFHGVHMLLTRSGPLGKSDFQPESQVHFEFLSVLKPALCFSYLIVISKVLNYN